MSYTETDRISGVDDLLAQTMRAGVYRGAGQVAAEDVPVPKISEGEMLIRVAACGICGTATLEHLRRRCDVLGPGPRVAMSTVLTLPDALRSCQRLFEQTGGLHAAGLSDPEGNLLTVREDVGRHNAVDKLVGRGLLDGALPLDDRVLVVSGRVSFEIVQKAALAGIPILAAVSAPSSLAVTTARDLGMTVVGFIRGQRANVYSHPGRLDLDC